MTGPYGLCISPSDSADSRRYGIMSNSNNIDEASRVSEPILNDAPPQKILNDIIPYLRESAESEGDMI